MVSRIASLLPFALLTVSALAVDFTPIVPENEPVRMRRFPRLLFKDGVHTISYTRPAGWTFSGAGNFLRLEATDSTHSLATIQEVPCKTPPAFDDVTIEALKAALVAALPPESTNVQIIEISKNPLVVSGHETLEITVGYFALTLDRVESVLFVNLPGSQLQFALNTLKSDFNSAHELFRRSYYSWQWLD